MHENHLLFADQREKKLKQYMLPPNEKHANVHTRR